MGLPCTGCVFHIGYLVHGNSKGEARGRNRHKSNSKRVARNLKERNVGTKRKGPKQSLNSAKDYVDLGIGERYNMYVKNNFQVFQCSCILFKYSCIDNQSWAWHFLSTSTADTGLKNRLPTLSGDTEKKSVFRGKKITHFLNVDLKEAKS